MADGGVDGQRILAVEDEAFLAFDLEDMLYDLGFAEVVVCASIEQAETALEGAPFSHGVFDLNLNGTMSTDLIECARGRGMHVVVASGYEPGTVPLPDPSVPRLTKPYDPEQLRAALGV